MNKCSPDQKEVLVLRYIQSFSIKETAGILGWTESKVKTTQHRGMKALKELMEEAIDKEGMADAQKL
jgi:RNA polymerase sigma-70 factor (ECF subfamily)